MGEMRDSDWSRENLLRSDWSVPKGAIMTTNFKNFKIVLSELSPNLAMILVPDFFLTRLVGTIYRLEGLNKRLI